uniref:Uncharacterized protein n=1 Tax=Melanopsichium pennsylvanicum 4 TaxID=1398559 RepID=A0A077QUF4_9BASI|nr:uncharacterized protein BN887_06116 [Melanopsichium pennsylvanicum 4]
MLLSVVAIWFLIQHTPPYVSAGVFLELADILERMMLSDIFRRPKITVSVPEKFDDADFHKGPAATPLKTQSHWWQIAVDLHLQGLRSALISLTPSSSK